VAAATSFLSAAAITDWLGTEEAIMPWQLLHKRGRPSQIRPFCCCCCHHPPAAGWSPLHRLAQSAAECTSAADRQRFLHCISATIDRLVAVELQEAMQEAAAQQQQQQQQQQLPLQEAVDCARQCVLQYVIEAPAPSWHYNGLRV
jgi:hypothetical protein